MQLLHCPSAHSERVRESSALGAERINCLGSVDQTLASLLLLYLLVSETVLTLPKTNALILLFAEEAPNLVAKGIGGFLGSGESGGL